MLRRQRRDRSGLRRWRPGPGSVAGSPGMAVVPPDDGAGMAALDREIAMVARALREHGETGRGELARLVGARYWGPGRFGAALAEAVAEGRARRMSRTTFAPAGDDAAATD